MEHQVANSGDCERSRRVILREALASNAGAVGEGDSNAIDARDAISKAR